MIFPIRQALRRLLQLYRQGRIYFSGVSITPPHQFAGNLDCQLGVGINGKGRIRIQSGACLESGVILHAFGGGIELGKNVFLGPHTVIYGHGNVTIGDDCLIAMHCRILSSNHTIPPIDTPIRSQPDVLLPTRIGRDVWLGAGVTVLGGVTIGDGCIVGAGAVVTKDLPAGSIALGVPAEIKGYRPGASLVS